MTSSPLAWNPGQVDESSGKPDLDSRAHIEEFVRCFYARVLRDEVLAPIFLDVAAIDLDVHLPHIVDYWCKLLLGEQRYQRHTMNIHRRLHDRRELSGEDFARWLNLFITTADWHFAGERTERAKRVATSIAGNMERSLG
ncbi:group III truncated hemoglobin [Parahaliea aestuarii]|uniref:Group III truncated hemoglobin n=1 Tax=Parahaliea aestuarii TaxID=1852021 RepID=A0A5C8ZV00_9GAMM|nr:group III truncated hemoglobin [Parahaliea aestuarii]TXS91584.1 group III truncated hemoglobin [Parahaliea aestuarii]